MSLKSLVIAGLRGSLLLWFLSASASTQTMGVKERFTAFAVDVNAAAPRNTAIVDIHIDRWSTEAERKALTSTLLEQGPDALLRALQQQRSVGRISTPDSLGYDLRFAYQEPGEDGGRRVIVATDRPIGYWEARDQPRSINYPFTVIEMRIGRDGTGEGKMSIATKITAVGNTIALENYEAQPVRLQSIRSKQ